MDGIARHILTMLVAAGVSTTSAQNSGEKKNSGENVISYVNPFIGTGAVDGSSLSGNTYPGATSPFGMIQLSPDTRNAPDWDAASGYDYNDKTIVGFSHTHLSGTGAADLFDVLLMPFTGKINTVPGDAAKQGSGYRSRFSHREETATAGYYRVHLLDYDIQAELTATTRVGIHRYTFPKGSAAHVIIDLGHKKNGNNIIASQIRQVNDHTIEGFRLITGWAKLRRVYFRAEFSRPILHTILAGDWAYYDDARLINGTNLRSVLDFDTKDTTPLVVKVGLSPVSIENAKGNIEQEAPGWDFGHILHSVQLSWEHELQKISVQADPQQKEIFYTALYHTMVQPNTMSDFNGDYQNAAFTTGKTAAGSSFYSTFSLWDTYRATHPLYTIIQQKRTADFVNSMILQYHTYGYLPIWQLWGEENYCMIGNHAIPVIVDAALKGIGNIDLQRAYEAVKGSSMTSHPGSPFAIWEKYGYMPENLLSQSVSITLEMAYDDWCVAQLAKRLGKSADYRRFMERSGFYKHLFDAQTRFFRAKDDKGNMIEPFDPLKYGGNGGQPYTEGNAWQYAWYVPHDAKGMIDLYGGDEAFCSKLDSFFTLTGKPGEVNGNASGFIGQYAHGNEPSHHIAYLYDYAGQPWKTQQYVSEVLQHLYSNSSAGYAGNEDCGQMSAWYVFSSLGFYPVNPAGGRYAIGSPAVKQAVISLPAGKQFKIVVHNGSKENIYIQSARLNGKKYSHSYITNDDIMKGGIIEFEMGAQPNFQWGVSPGDRPDDTIIDKGFSPAVH